MKEEGLESKYCFTLFLLNNINREATAQFSVVELPVSANSSPGIREPNPDHIIGSEPCYVAFRVSTTGAPMTPNPTVILFSSSAASVAPLCTPRRRGSGSRSEFGSGYSWLTWSSRRRSGLSIIPKQVLFNRFLCPDVEFCT